MTFFGNKIFADTIKDLEMSQWIDEEEKAQRHTGKKTM